MSRTKGPWKTEKSNSCIAIIAGDYGYGVAKTYGTGTEDKANAALIAAAPQLLEILTKLVSLWASTEQTYEEAYYAMFKGEGRELWDEALAAIAKAEGGTI